MLIVAILWEKKKEVSTVDYMAIDSNTFEISIEPSQIDIKNTNDSVVQAIEMIFKKINEVKANRLVRIEYKSVIRRYPNSTKLSIHFHDTLVNEIKSANYGSARLSSKLKKQNLVIFKKALRELKYIDIDHDSYVSHLWGVALHATKRSCRNSIKKLWKKRNGVKRMTVNFMGEFDDFISTLKSKK